MAALLLRLSKVEVLVVECVGRKLLESCVGEIASAFRFRLNWSPTATSTYLRYPPALGTRMFSAKGPFKQLTVITVLEGCMMHAEG